MKLGLGLLVAAMTLAVPSFAYAQDDDTDDETADDESGWVDDEDGDADAETTDGSNDIPEKPKKKGDDDDDDDDDDDEEEEGAQFHLLDFMTFGIGGMFQGGGNFLDKPGDQSGPGGQTIDPGYPGFAGPTLGGGFFIDIRFFGFVGIEMDVLFTTDKGTAELERTDLNTGAKQIFNVEIAHSAVHIPLLLKGSIPAGIAAPTLFLGPEFVIPSANPVDNNGNPFGRQFASHVESYTMFTFGLGIEFRFPIPYVDIRLPMSLRGSFNPGVAGERTDPTRTIFTESGGNVTIESYSSEWKFQATGTIGLSAHF